MFASPVSAPLLKPALPHETTPDTVAVGLWTLVGVGVTVGNSVPAGVTLDVGVAVEGLTVGVNVGSWVELLGVGVAVEPAGVGVELINSESSFDSALSVRKLS